MAKPARKISLVKPVKLDLGCGKNKAGPEWTGVDSRKFDGVDTVLDLCAKRIPRGYPSEPARIEGYGLKAWPWEDNSVDEIRSSHFVEHLDAAERAHFVNECFRILKPGCTLSIVVPHWGSCRAYGDPTHKWPPVTEFWFNYLNKAWRDANAPHLDFYSCDYEMPPVLAIAFGEAFVHKSDEVRQFAAAHHREGASDLMATLRKPEA